MSGSWWVIANPYSGREGEVAGRARAALSALEIDFELMESANPAHLAELVRAGLDAGATQFAGVGGDGTAHLIVNALMAAGPAEPPTLAILPAGSGSDFIRTFALPRTLEAAARHLISDSLYPCDVAKLSGFFGDRYVLNAANVGVGAASLRPSERLPRRLGAIRYSIGFWLALARFPPRHVRITAGARSYAGPAINVVAANGQYFGGGMNIAPNATVMDGKFDLQVFHGPRRLAFSVMPRIIRGTHVGHAAMTRFVTPAFELECESDWPVEADGEILGAGSVRGEMIPGALRFKI